MMEPVLLVGSGPMADSYAKVLKSEHIPFTVLGRSESRAQEFAAKWDIEYLHGGVSENAAAISRFTTAINAVSAENLASTARLLTEGGIRKMLLEKPGALNREDMQALERVISAAGSTVMIAYNRRFMASAQKGLEMIEEDGGIQSMLFEFTEWSHVIEGLEKAEGVKESWLAGNSSHVIDMAFFFGGEPVQMNSFSAGELSWHPKSRFTGAGTTSRGVVFSYFADWASAGRWSLEVLTAKRRIIYRPLEKIQVQERGKIDILPVENVDYTEDTEYKPGIYRQTLSFLRGDYSRFLDIKGQLQRFEIYNNILQGGAYIKDNRNAV